MMKDMMKKGKDPGKLKEASQQMGDSFKEAWSRRGWAVCS